MINITRFVPSATVLATCAALSAPVAAQDDAQALAKKLSNPIAALISVPFQFNYDHAIGASDGTRWTTNVQPVVPVSISRDWNLISRTIVPVVAQHNVLPGSNSQFGLGDTLQSAFFSPKAPTSNGWIWGAGPVLLLPTGTDEELSARKWGAGPTAVLLKQVHGWTYGALANHVWSFGGARERSDISATFLQPFLSFTTPTAWTYGANAESSYDWTKKQWSVPVNLTVTKVTKVGTQLISVGGGVRYWANGPSSGPDKWGVRLVVTFLYPK